MIVQKTAIQRAHILHPYSGRETKSVALDIEEAVSLAVALGVDIAASASIPIREIKAANYFGSGKIHELGEINAKAGINLVIVNAALAPIQQRNLEELWGTKVIDRTGMILEIFALRAATKEGRLQVELARLSYERSRLVRTWTHLERQRGGQGFLAGPGETQIESDRRQIADKMVRLQNDLDQVRRTRALQRTKRRRAPERVVALIGYTNTGKSTLFNLLTKGGVMAKDMLFATLDTTHRILPLPSGQKAVMSDTVGFISDLPTELVEAFRATLEEVKEADLLVHVRDISDPLSESRKIDVLEILDSIDAGPSHSQDIIEVWNKTDLLPKNEERDLLEGVDSHNRDKNLTKGYALSCKTKKGLAKLLGGIEESLSSSDEIVDVVIEPKDFSIRAWLHENGDVLNETISDRGSYAMRVRLPQVNADMLTARHPHVFN
ncbi:MAG: GTPase HflX [Robiginitomaculum sp.]